MFIFFKQLIRVHDDENVYFHQVFLTLFYHSFLELFVLKVTVYLNSDTSAFPCPAIFYWFLVSLVLWKWTERKWERYVVKISAFTEQQTCVFPLRCCALIASIPHLLIDPLPPPPSLSFFLLPQTWFSAQMRWMWTSLSWLTHCLRGPLTPAGWLSSSPSPPHTIWWSMAMRSGVDHCSPPLLNWKIREIFC